jgi:hypothetical protein
MMQQSTPCNTFTEIHNSHIYFPEVTAMSDDAIPFDQLDAEQKEVLLTAMQNCGLSVADILLSPQNPDLSLQP